MTSPYDRYTRLRFDRPHPKVLRIAMDNRRMNTADGAMHAELAKIWRDADDELDAKAVDIAVRLAEGAKTAICWTKHALNNWLRSAGPAFDASLALEFLGFSGPEVKEGLAAHLEKRKPVFPSGTAR